MPILKTKLHIPPSQHGQVLRQHLFDRLNESWHETQVSFARKLTLVSAPAGFGKTTLVAEWVQQAECPAAWLSLDAEDNDISRFLTYFATAVQKGFPHLDAAIQPALPVSQPLALQATSTSMWLTLLINNLADTTTPLILVLDDYHVIDAKAVHEALIFFIEHMPPSVHLVMTSRTDPPLPLAQLRVGRQLTEIREADLRFTLDETRAFFSKMDDVTLSSEQLEALDGRTEGWVASLQLVGLAMQAAQNPSDVSQFLADFTDSHHYIVEYLIDEVLQQCAPEIRRFLLETAILDRFCAPLCDAVTGQQNGKALLSQLQRKNLFIVPLDNRREWYRYHHLFASAMRQYLLQEEEVADPQKLHHRASSWHKAQPGMMGEAIHHALQAGDSDRAAQWIADTASDTLWGRGEATQLRRQIESLPSERLTHNPQLAAFLAWACYISGDPKKAKTMMSQALSALTPIDESSSSFSTPVQEMVTGLAAALQAFEARSAGDFEKSIQLSQQALLQLAEQNQMLQAVLTFNLGAVYEQIGDLTKSTEANERLLRITENVNNVYLQLEALGGLAYVAHERGQLHRAYDIGLEALQIVDARPLPGVAVIRSGLANLCYEWNKLDEADRHAAQAIELAEQSGLVSVLPGVYFRRAVIALHQNDKAAADQYRQRIWQVKQIMPTPFLDILLHSLVADLDLRSGHVDKAWRWLQTTDLLDKELLVNATTSDMYPLIVSTQIAVVRCRTHADNDFLATTVERLHQLQRIAKRVGHVNFQIKIQLILGLAYDLQRDEDSAVEAVAEALSLAEPSQYCRIFIDLGSDMVRLLQFAQRKGITPDYTSWLLSVFASENVIPVQEDSITIDGHALIEPLHDQELAILRLIAVGLTNPQIAEERFLSVNTVKWYIKQLYEKLDVHNRIEATTRAKELGLIPGP